MLMKSHLFQRFYNNIELQQLNRRFQKLSYVICDLVFRVFFSPEFYGGYIKCLP